MWHAADRTPPAGNAALLRVGGYAYSRTHDVWTHHSTGRMLDGGVSRTLTPDQLGEWIAEGLKADRRP